MLGDAGFDVNEGPNPCAERRTAHSDALNAFLGPMIDAEKENYFNMCGKECDAMYGAVC